MSKGPSLSRRSFLKWSGALSGAAAIGGLAAGELSLFQRADAAAADAETVIIPTSCSNNCGGRCVIRAHVKNGVVTRIESDPGPDVGDQPALRGCLRGRSYRQIMYHPDRLKYPMKRVGKRGEGKFERISWDEATTIIADQIKRISSKYGPLSLYVLTSMGIFGQIRGDNMMKRLLGCYPGDYLNNFGFYSFGQTMYATPFTYGTPNSGNDRRDWVNSKLIIMMGYNPAETILGTNSVMYLRRAKEAGARIICIDPRYTDTALALADEWIPIRPGTDAALLDAMAYVIITENLHDQKFLDTYCLGFDEEHMPEGIPAGNSFKHYILGKADAKPKTPEWAEAITGIPADRIRSLAREYASIKPAAMMQGFGPQRHANGEATVRSCTVLPAMTGNVGIKGGWAGGAGYLFNGTPFPNLNNLACAVPPMAGGATKISFFQWTDAIVRGKEMTAQKDLIQGAAQLPGNIKALFNIAGNTLVNQHSEINKTIEILKDESLCEFILTTDIFMTPSALYSDLVLPGTSYFERENIIQPWVTGDYILYMNKVIDAPYECRDEYDWMTDVAAKLGVKDKFTEGRSTQDWLRWCCEVTAKAYPDFPGFDEFKKRGLFRLKSPANLTIAFEKQIQDPDKHKFGTPSGKIEIFSKRLWDRNNRELVPAIPKYVPAFDGVGDPLMAKYPLQLTGFHQKQRVHSMHYNNPWMAEAARQELWINPIDAEPRGILNGDKVKVYNDRGATLVAVKVTPRILPGVVALPQGAWFKPGPDGIDTNGSINVLTTHRPSYMSHANSQHSVLVEVAKA